MILSPALNSVQNVNYENFTDRCYRANWNSADESAHENRPPDFGPRQRDRDVFAKIKQKR